jgi:hypothetical protein
VSEDLKPEQVSRFENVLLILGWNMASSGRFITEDRPLFNQPMSNRLPLSVLSSSPNHLPSQFVRSTYPHNFQFGVPSTILIIGHVEYGSHSRLGVSSLAKMRRPDSVTQIALLTVGLALNAE